MRMIMITILLVTTTSYTCASAFVSSSLGLRSIGPNVEYPYQKHHRNNRDTIKPLYSLFTNQNDSERKDASRKRILKERENKCKTNERRNTVARDGTHI